MSNIRVLMITGHPRPGSYGHALARAYVDALPPGTEVRQIDLAQAEFDPHVHLHSPKDQELEPVLAQAQGDITWAHHLVVIFPTWWVACPQS